MKDFLKDNKVILILILLLGLVLRLWNLNKPEGLWNDEYITYSIASLKFNTDFFEAIKRNCHAPLHYFYLKIWMLVFRNSDFMLRLSSLVPNETLKELYKDFIEAREAMEAPITRQGLKVLIDRCEKLSNHNVRIQKLLLETALVNGWKNVFLPSETHQQEAKAEAINELREFYGGGIFNNE
jgi:hypothetical protein